MFMIFVNTSFFLKIWNDNFGKDNQKSIGDKDDEKKGNDKTAMENKNHEDFKKDNNDQPRIDWAEPLPTESVTPESRVTVLYHSVSVKLKSKLEKFKQYIASKNKKELSAYFLLAMLTFILTTTQVVVIHDILPYDRFRIVRNSTRIKQMCNLLEENYLIEELFYLIPSLFFFIILWFFHRSRRFNKYIMVKFKRYFKSDYFKKNLQHQKTKRKDDLTKKEERLKKAECGRCRYGMYKCFKNGFCRIFCCLFCCSCCVPPGSNNRCFISYCCYQGWKQTDCHKVSIELA